MVSKRQGGKWGREGGLEGRGGGRAEKHGRGWGLCHSDVAVSRFCVIVCVCGRVCARACVRMRVF